MKELFKMFGVLFVVLFIVGLFTLGVKRIFMPIDENINRIVYENTKSYVHGKVQTLANYYRQWQLQSENRQAIESTIRIEFANFDADKINSSELRSFLIKVRGY